MKVVQHALRLVRAVDMEVMPCARREDREIAGQLHRAVRSIALNTAEGWGLGRGGRQRLHFRYALGSVRESTACVRVLVATGTLSADEARGVLRRMRRVAAMLEALVGRA